MAEDFSDLFSKITRQRQLRKEDLRRKTAQAVGGTAGTLMGERAPEAFAKRAPDYSKRMMTAEQKRLKRLELLKYKEKLDQFYYGEEQKRYLRELEQEMQNRRALLQAETAKMREMGASARERARNMRLALSEDIKEDVSRGKTISTPSDRLKQSLKQVIPPAKLKTAEEREQAFLKQFNRKSKKDQAAIQAKYRNKGGYQKVYADYARLEYEKDLRDANQSILNAAQSLMQAGNRDDIVNGMPILANMGKSSTDGLLQALGGNNQQVFLDLKNNHLQEQNRLLEDIELKQLKRAKESARTFGSSGGVGQIQKALMTAPRSRMRTAAPVTMRGPAATPQAPIAAPEMPESEAMQQPGFMGIPGVKIPETSQQRVSEMFNIIEEYPEHPPAKQAKMDIMASDELAQYAKQFGPNPPMDKVYKEAVRDARLRQKEIDRTFKEKRAEKRLAEVKSRFAKTRKPLVPVTGSDKGIGDTEDVGI